MLPVGYFGFGAQRQAVNYSRTQAWDISWLMKISSFCRSWKRWF
jgi:hypothetical protein